MGPVGRRRMQVCRHRKSSSGRRINTSAQAGPTVSSDIDVPSIDDFEPNRLAADTSRDITEQECGDRRHLSGRQRC